MAPPAEKKKKHSSADHRSISSAAIGENQQQKPGSVVTSSYGNKTKMNSWICADVLMDILPFFRRRQLGLKLALISPRFDILVDKHFDGKSQWTIWREIRVHKMGTKARLSVVANRKAKIVRFPSPDHPLPNKIRFKELQIDYLDHSVIKFLRSNQQIFDKWGTNLDLHVPCPSMNVQPIWDVFAREIWPIFAPNIRHLNFSDSDHLDNLRCRISPTLLTDLNQLNSIEFCGLLPDGIADDGPNASSGQILSKWLHTSRKDGQPKELTYYDQLKPLSINWIINFKEVFLRATTPSASYIIRLELFESAEIGPFEVMNERTNEMLTLEKEENNDENMEEEDDGEYINSVDWLLKRWQIGRTIQWEDGKSDNVNNVNFSLCGFGPFSPPKASQKNAKNRLKMSAGASERKSE